MMHIGQVKHDNWMAKAYLLGGNSMLIADFTLVFITIEQPKLIRNIRV